MGEYNINYTSYPDYRKYLQTRETVTILIFLIKEFLLYIEKVSVQAKKIGLLLGFVLQISRQRGVPSAGNGVTVFDTPNNMKLILNLE